MGWDANINFKNKVDKQKVEEILELLKYKKIKKDLFMYYEEKDYKSLLGNAATIYFEENRLKLHLRTFMHCSDYDLYYMNYTIKTIKRFFECTFYTDEGNNRYFKHGEIITKSEAGCYKAFFNIENDFSYIKLYIDIMKNDKRMKMDLPKDYKEYNPMYIMTTMGLPYLCTIIENYFRNLFIALFKYSDNKEKVIKSVKIYNSDLNKVSNEDMQIEEAIARAMSFQNIEKIVQNFKILNSEIDIKGYLNKPYKRRKESLYETINRVLEQRHNFIHSKLFEYDYDLNKFEKDVNLVEEALNRVYKEIVKFYSWEE